MPAFDLTVSIVLYNTASVEVEHVIELIQLSKLKTKIFLVDNSPVNTLRVISEKYADLEYVFNNANLGYGSGHNIAIERTKLLSNYHLVLNADIDFDPSVLQVALDYMERNPGVGMLSPMIKHPNGTIQYFCRTLPTPFDLFARRFLPAFIKPLFKDRLDNYMLLHRDYTKAMNIPNLSGCFMLLRQSVLTRVKGFDENFFMYLEDVDLTRRLYQISKTVYYPKIEIIHKLGQGSYHHFKLTLYHIKSAIYYFNKWGWFTDKKRTEVNAALITADDIWVIDNDSKQFVRKVKQNV
jgi:GT2 family glycosyltransferase